MWIRFFMALSADSSFDSGPGLHDATQFGCDTMTL